ncbi:MAG: response regulator [Rhodospirillales bacterium]|nr:response regulator [Rhodospirillales bacterium]
MHDSRGTVVAIVDDDEAVRESLRFLLETAGFRVETFASGKQFLASRGRGPACLVVDQNMPQLTGIELLEQLRARGCTLRVALMTGSPSPDLSRRARELGAAMVLEKPLRDDVLLQFVHATEH